MGAILNTRPKIISFIFKIAPQAINKCAGTFVPMNMSNTRQRLGILDEEACWLRVLEVAS